MRILIAGLRGFSGVEGGVESHVAHLYRNLVQRGVDVEVAVRSRYHYEQGTPTTWGFRYRKFWAPRTSGFEALLHTLIVVCWAAVSRPDILHLHAVGPGLFTPLARLFGLKVVFTHHGPDYAREKWGRVARFTLRLGEYMGCKYSNECIAISEGIQTLIRQRYGRDSVLIPNGVPKARILNPGRMMAELDLTPAKYVLQVSRLVPEKRQSDLIEAFIRSDIGSQGWSLVFVGTLDQNDAYSKRIMQQAEADQNVIFAGFRSGDELAEILSNAGIFVLPSTHEGLPIALLEALSYGLRCVVSDIPANVEVGLEKEHYYPTGDIDALSERLGEFAAQPVDLQVRQRTIQWVADRYDWKDIAESTLLLVHRTLGNLDYTS